MIKSRARNHLTLLGSRRADAEPPYFFHAIALVEPTSDRVKDLLTAYLENPRNGVKQREYVLDAWINAGGQESPAIAVVCQFLRTRDAYSEEGMQLFGILARVCARAWEPLLRTVKVEPARGRDLCYLIGHGLPSVRVDMEQFVQSLGQWPAEEECYIWKAVLGSNCSPEHYIGALCEWLVKNMRRRGYGVVLESIKERMKKDVTFPLRLPTEVYADLKSRLDNGVSK